MIKYNHNLRASIVFTDYDNNTYSIFQELETNSQDDLWKFLDHHQTSLNQNGSDKLIEDSIMFDIYEGQDNFLDGSNLRFDLIDIGVYGMMIIGLDSKMDGIIKNVFDDLEEEQHKDYSLIKEIK